ncbi:hypothetical protein CYMTET_20607 [Cymbomonas tetramitiformis]|uniref:Hflx-type G domain-containing protein n=1 Tax=Cymbomonas tetramitiformis TaxID=36881 RepID=A0AAE0L437_9CHLO|nr:hypothetical protein CYMTET_20607 [Cymbomonas tetramitiformis]
MFRALYFSRHISRRVFYDVSKCQPSVFSRLCGWDRVCRHNFHEAGEIPLPYFVVQPRCLDHEFKLQEALSLAQSAREDAEDPPHLIVQCPKSRRTTHAATYFGSGTVHELTTHVKSSEVDSVFVNEILTGVQQRNLENSIGKPVVDRVGVILEIFRQRARTREAVLQVELALLQYTASRLVRKQGAHGARETFGATGDSEVVSGRGRTGKGQGVGGLGGGGGEGETEIELQQRQLKQRRAKLERQLAQVRRTRKVHRASRERDGIHRVALVGYTNAGKTTLLAQLSGCEQLMPEDRLFATLDPTLRRVTLPSGDGALVGDTVGFIQDLPLELVEAFRATLEEVLTADVLLADMISVDELELDSLAEGRHALPISAIEGTGLLELLGALEGLLADIINERDTQGLSHKDEYTKFRPQDFGLN